LEKVNFQTDVDRYCIILVGRPSFVGTKLWEEKFVNQLKSSDAPIDVIALVWDHDVYGTGNSKTACSGFFDINTHDDDDSALWDLKKYITDQVVDDNGNGKVPLKTQFTDYIKSQFSFASTVTVCTVSYYDLLKRLRQRHPYNNHDQVGWQAQHYQLSQAYLEQPELFNSYTNKSVILRTRYDLNLKIFELAKVANQIQIFQHKYDKERLDPYIKRPNVLLQYAGWEQQHPSILGNQFWSHDTMYALDGLGLKQLCTMYEDWVADDLDKRFCGNSNRPTAHMHLSEFFLTQNYNIHFSDQLGNVTLRMWKEYHNHDDFDDHRLRWYNYTIEQQQSILGFKI
jgi:hypothetical protein